MNQSYLGIDISKKSFHVSLIKDIEKKPYSKHFSNDAAGFAELLEWLGKRKVEQVHACMEATGKYTEGLATFLHDRGFLVSIVNPAQIKGFASSELARTKTDKADAKLIARFCLRIQPGLWQPEPLHVRRLKALQRRFDDVQSIILQEENRKESADTQMHASYDSSIEFHKNQLRELERDIQSHIDDDPDLKEKKALLETIPGVSERTATKSLLFLSNPEKFSKARQVSAFLGLNPKERQSGTSVRGKNRISKMGDAQLRKVFYMPAMAAIRYNPSIKAFAERLKSRGKSGKVIVVAAMKKLVHIIYGVLKHKQPYSAQWCGSTN